MTNFKDVIRLNVEACIYNERVMEQVLDHCLVAVYVTMAIVPIIFIFGIKKEWEAVALRLSVVALSVHALTSLGFLSVLHWVDFVLT